jgi:4'-phosphopantetheinyl transferase
MSFPRAWAVAEVSGKIAPKEVHIWGWRLDSLPLDLSAHVSILSDSELQRMHAFHFPEHRARYGFTHACVRRILGAYLDQPPTQITFAVGSFGKPAVEGESGLHFSLSHSKTVAVVAVTREGPVGVDVEDVRPIEEAVAATHFSPAEVVDLSTLRGEDWLAGFYRCWTRKEAVLKAEGVGLHRALDGFDVSLLPDAPAELRGTREPFEHPWQLHDVPPAADTAGALATAHRDAVVLRFRLGQV